MDIRTVFIILPSLSIIIFLLLIATYFLRKDRNPVIYKAIHSVLFLFLSGFVYFFRLSFDAHLLYSISISIGLLSMVYIVQGTELLYNSEYKMKKYLGVSIAVFYGLLSFFLLRDDSTYFLRVAYYILIALGLYAYNTYVIMKNTELFKSPMFYLMIIYFVFQLPRLTYVLLNRFNLIDTSIPTFELIFATMAIFTVNVTIVTLVFEIGRLDSIKLKETLGVLSSSYTEVKKISETDELTKLYNRRKIIEILNELVKISTSNKSSFSIAIIDINDFKYINDNYGHAIGDEILKFVSDFLVNSTRDYDYVGRWGGDEFILVLPKTDERVVDVVKKKLKDRLSNTSNDIINEPITFSIGSSTYKKDTSINELIHDADINMYLEKQEYRDNKLS